MATSRIQTVFGVIAIGIGLIVAAVLGLFAYMSLTATPIHPDAQSVPAEAASEPAQQYTGAVERARQIVRAGVKDQNLPGLSVAVGINGTIVWAEGFGWADLATKVPVGPDTRFRIGTASVALTSAAVGVLMEQDKLKLDEKIRTYVPEFPEKQWPMTLGQVMAHVAGLRNDGGDEGPLYGSHCERTTDALQYFQDGKLLFEPGTAYRYSSYGWILVSAAIEKASGERFLTFMRRQVFEPLGMQDTRADTLNDPIPHLATPYFPKFSADPRYGPDPMRPVDYSCYAGASVFVSTPSDLVRFAMAINSGKLLRPETVKRLQSPQRVASGQETGYALGWDLETVSMGGQDTRWVGHDGTLLGGPAAVLITFPDRGMAISLISNTSYAGVEPLAVSVAQAFAEDGRTPARQ